MHEKLKNYLSRPFPLFLSYRQGVVYFIVMILIFALLANILQPFGINNWHECHKGLILTGYVVLYFAIYPLLYLILSHFLPNHYKADNWTLEKEFRHLLIYIPVTAIISWIFTIWAIEEVDLSISSFFRIEYYNSIMGFTALPCFGFLVAKSINPAPANIRLSTNGTIHSDELPREMIINKIPLIVDDICYVESKANNIHCWVLHKGVLKEVTIRYTLRKLEHHLKEYSQFLRCQNSFIVNMHHVKNWDTEQEKMVLHMKCCNKSIPVTTGISEAIKEKLRKHFIFKEV